MEDERILELFNKRDESALKAVEGKYGGLCYRVANNILNNKEDAQECVNDTYLAAWNSIPPQRPEKLSAFLARIARNKALTLYERSHRVKRGGGAMIGILSEVDGEIASNESADKLLNERYVVSVINSYLHSVDKNRAFIFAERYFMCRSVDDICGITGYSYNKVTGILFRMRSELRQRLREEGVEV